MERGKEEERKMKKNNNNDSDSRVTNNKLTERIYDEPLTHMDTVATYSCTSTTNTGRMERGKEEEGEEEQQ